MARSLTTAKVKHLPNLQEADESKLRNSKLKTEIIFKLSF